MLTDLILSITIFKKSTLLCECKGYQLISVFWERKKLPHNSNTKQERDTKSTKIYRYMN